MAKKRYSTEQILVLVYCVAWTAFLWTFVIGKLIVDGVSDYTTHYTDWNWTINAVFFLFDLLSYIPKLNSIQIFLLIFFVWLTFGSSWLVFWLIFILFAENPDIILNMSKEKGGKYSLGFLLNMNTVFHILPAIAILIYVFIKRKQIINVFYKLEVSLTKGAYGFLIFLAIVSPLIYIGVFQTVFNVKQIYGITMPRGLLALIALGVTFFMNGIPILIYFYKAKKRYAKKKKGSKK